MEENTVHPMQLMPRKTKPSTTSTRLSTHMKKPTLNWGNMAASSTDRPEVPPKAKWLGLLNQTMPRAVRIRPTFSRTKKERFASSFSFLKASLTKSIIIPFLIGRLRQGAQSARKARELWDTS